MEVFESLEEAYTNCVSDQDVIGYLSQPAVYDAVEANDGGLKYLGAFALVQVLRTFAPDVYVEVGAWRGCSSFIASQVLPDASIFVFDPSLHLIRHNLDRAKYASDDWATPRFQGIARRGTTLLFADDHQDVLERLVTAWARGYDFVLFDDDYGGRADHRTFRNSLSQADSLRPALSLMIKRLTFMSRPDVPLPSGADDHWRDKTLVELNKHGVEGWTHGEPKWVELR